MMVLLAVVLVLSLPGFTSSFGRASPLKTSRVQAPETDYVEYADLDDVYPLTTDDRHEPSNLESLDRQQRTLVKLLKNEEENVLTDAAKALRRHWLLGNSLIRVIIHALAKNHPSAAKPDKTVDVTINRKLDKMQRYLWGAPGGPNVSPFLKGARRKHDNRPKSYEKE